MIFLILISNYYELELRRPIVISYSHDQDVIVCCNTGEEMNHLKFDFGTNFRLKIIRFTRLYCVGIFNENLQLSCKNFGKKDKKNMIFTLY